MAPSTVTVRVPGSTSNCGAGFDTLGLALSLYNRVTLARLPTAAIEPVAGPACRAQGMARETAALFFRKAGLAPFGFSYSIHGDVPPSRGLGSSVTVRAGLSAGLNALAGSPLSREQLVEAVTELEGHPDNASAGVLGGFCAARSHPTTGAYLGAVRFEIPAELIFVVVSPEVEILTKESRGALPASLPYFDAVKSVNSAVYLTAAFATGDYERLRHAVGDFLHEPYRLPKIPHAAEAIAAGITAGAYTGWLSGSGSSVLCVARKERAESVGRAMEAAFLSGKIASQVHRLAADNRGLTIES